MEGYSFIGPDCYMDSSGQLYKKASDQYVRITDKYTEAEDRFIKKHANRKGGNEYEKTYDEDCD